MRGTKLRCTLIADGVSRVIVPGSGRLAMGSGQMRVREGSFNYNFYNNESVSIHGEVSRIVRPS